MQHGGSCITHPAVKSDLLSVQHFDTREVNPSPEWVTLRAAQLCLSVSKLIFKEEKVTKPRFDFDSQSEFLPNIKQVTYWSPI